MPSFSLAAFGDGGFSLSGQKEAYAWSFGGTNGRFITAPYHMHGGRSLGIKAWQADGVSGKITICKIVVSRFSFKLSFFKKKKTIILPK